MEMTADSVENGDRTSAAAGSRPAVGSPPAAAERSAS
jgi:hypothetical protein